MKSADDRTTGPSTAPAAPSADRGFWWAYAVCATAALVPLWSVTYLPMADLPQHAYQIHVWTHFDDAEYGYREQMEFQWFSPYLLGYAVWRALAFAMPIEAAGRVLVSLIVLSLPLSFLAWFQASGQRERWWALLGFPLAFGVAFYLGILSFMLATPLAWVAAGLAWRYAEKPTARLGTGLFLLFLALLLAHAYAFGFAVLVGAGLVCAQAPGLRAALARLWPFYALSVPAAAYIALGQWAVGKVQAEAGGGTIWQLGWSRVAALPELLLGMSWDWLPSVWVLAVALAGLLTLRPVRALANWVALGVALASTFLAPLNYMNVAQVWCRFPLFLVPGALSGFRTVTDRVRVRWLRVVLLGLTLGWLVFLTARFARFEAETRPFAEVVRELPPRCNVCSLVFDRSSESVPDVHYLSFAWWYCVEKGGHAGFSFAEYPLMVFRYRSSHVIQHDEALAWHPEWFSWPQDGGADYFLVRAPGDLGPQLFREADVPVRLVAHSGTWFLYQPVRAGPAPGR